VCASRVIVQRSIVQECRKVRSIDKGRGGRLVAEEKVARGIGVARGMGVRRGRFLTFKHVNIFAHPISKYSV